MAHALVLGALGSVTNTSGELRDGARHEKIRHRDLEACLSQLGGHGHGEDGVAAEGDKVLRDAHLFGLQVENVAPDLVDALLRLGGRLDYLDELRSRAAVSACRRNTAYAPVQFVRHAIEPLAKTFPVELLRGQQREALDWNPKVGDHVARHKGRQVSGCVRRDCCRHGGLVTVDDLDDAIPVGFSTKLLEGNQGNQLALAWARGRVQDGSVLDFGVLAEHQISSKSAYLSHSSNRSQPVMIFCIHNPANTADGPADISRVRLQRDVAVDGRRDGTLGRAIAVDEADLVGPDLDVLAGHGLASEDEGLQGRHVGGLDELDDRGGQEAPVDVEVVDHLDHAAVLGPLVGHADAGAVQQRGHDLHDAHVEAVRAALQHSILGADPEGASLRLTRVQEGPVLDDAALWDAGGTRSKDDVEGTGQGGAGDRELGAGVCQGRDGNVVDHLDRQTRRPPERNLGEGAEDDVGLDLVENLVQASHRVRGIKEHHRTAGLDDRQERDYGPARLLKAQGHNDLGPDAQGFLQVVSQLGGDAVEVAVAEIDIPRVDGHHLLPRFAGRRRAVKQLVRESAGEVALQIHGGKLGRVVPSNDLVSVVRTEKINIRNDGHGALGGACHDLLHRVLELVEDPAHDGLGGDSVVKVAQDVQLLVPANADLDAHAEPQRLLFLVRQLLRPEERSLLVHVRRLYDHDARKPAGLAALPAHALDVLEAGVFKLDHVGGLVLYHPEQLRHRRGGPVKGDSKRHRRDGGPDHLGYALDRRVAAALDDAKQHIVRRSAVAALHESPRGLDDGGGGEARPGRALERQGDGHLAVEERVELLAGKRRPRGRRDAPELALPKGPAFFRVRLLKVGNESAVRWRGLYDGSRRRRLVRGLHAAEDEALGPPVVRRVVDGPDEVAAGEGRVDNGQSRKRRAQLERQPFVFVNVSLDALPRTPLDDVAVGGAPDDLEKAAELVHVDYGGAEDACVASNGLPRLLESLNIQLGRETVDLTEHVGLRVLDRQRDEARLERRARQDVCDRAARDAVRRLERREHRFPLVLGNQRKGLDVFGVFRRFTCEPGHLCHVGKTGVAEDVLMGEYDAGSPCSPGELDGRDGVASKGQEVVVHAERGGIAAKTLSYKTHNRDLFTGRGSHGG
ncbi:hypothetical protein PpBr36_03901 [Pyricularia pennisetigena]|uniref:hypothetical protein n=1 Tax=Pyricularia pennisetigena TaxID=1578925 RepID=UPI001152F624|nr:hypothetical protein PpBr36_03901 [Pyricularia pennisetigena]TLS31579.1 hypothetical protein PpBr36_03901 [Pyricularia pennisetigena]